MIKTGDFGSLGAGTPSTLFVNGVAMRGKYANATIEHILTANPGYIIWVAENVNDHGLTQEQIKTAHYAKEQQDEDEADKKRELGAESVGFFRRFKS